MNKGDIYEAGPFFLDGHGDEAGALKNSSLLHLVKRRRNTEIFSARERIRPAIIFSTLKQIASRRHLGFVDVPDNTSRLRPKENKHINSDAPQATVADECEIRPHQSALRKNRVSSIGTSTWITRFLLRKKIPER